MYMKANGHKSTVFTGRPFPMLFVQNVHVKSITALHIYEARNRFSFSSNLIIYGDNMNKISDVKKVILSKL